MNEIENEDDELFNSAVSDEPEIPVAEVIAQQEPVQQVEPAADLTAEKPPIPPKPEYRLKEDAEARRAAEAALADERAEKSALKQRLEALERANQPDAPKVEKAAKPDPLLDPDGYEKYIDAKVEDRLLHDRRESSMAAAHGKYKQEFEEAMTSATQRLDPALKARMQSARDPGETLMQWHREEKAKAEVGTDLSAYKQRLRDEALKDPEFRKAAMEAWRADAEPLVNGRPRVELPPSLSGASRSNAALRSSNDDVSDDALWEQTTA